MIKRTAHPIDELELMAYLDGELPRERAAATAAHLETCKECRALAEDLRAVSQKMASWQVDGSQAEITSSVSAELEEHIRAQEGSLSKPSRFVPRRWKMRRVLLGGFAVATLLSLLLVVSITNYRTSLSPRGFFASNGADRIRSTPEYENYSKDTNGLFSTASTSRSEEGRVSTTYVSPIIPSAAPPQSSSPATARPVTAAPPVPSGPMIVRTVELALVSADFDQSRNRVQDILRRHNGYLGDLTVGGSTTSARTLTATLRIPAEYLDAAIAELKTLGKVESESQKGEEVSEQYVDLQARLQNSRNSEQRLTQLLQRAGRLSDVLEVEQQIETVRENIERMEAERKNLAKQVAYSTLNMKISEDYKESVHVVPDSTSRRLRHAAVEGYEVMVAGLINLLLFLFSWGPSLLLWGIVLFFPARWLWKRRGGLR